MRRDEFAELVRPLLEQEGVELVEFGISRHQRSQVFRVSIDREDGVTIDDCARLSRGIADLLDARPLLRGTYQLEVSSAGMNRPIWSLEHFRRFEGEEVRIELDAAGSGGRSLRGTIGPVEGLDVWILLSGGERRLLRMEEIGKARLHMDPWKKRPAREKSRLRPARGSRGDHGVSLPSAHGQEGDGRPDHDEHGDG